MLLEVAGRRGRSRTARPRLASSFRDARREADEVVAAFGLRERRRLVDDGWAGAVLAASGSSEAGPAVDRMIRLAVRVSRAHAEPVLAELLELVPGGLEERDVDEATVEYALYGAPGELPDIGELRAAAGGALVDVSTSEVADDSNWRDWHRPLDVGPLRVRPPWEAERPGALDVVIDPGQAFGTGAHPSTRLTLELLVGVPPGGPLADWGCGSGILSVAAARLGFDPVLACDHEPRPSRRRWRGSGERVAASEASDAPSGVAAVDAAVRATARAGSSSPATICAARPARGRRRCSPTSCARCCSRSPR